MLRLMALVVDWSLHNRPVVLLGTLLLVVLGVHSARNLPIDAVPDVTNVQVQLITSAPALSPLEVEQYVTVPVERAMSGIPKVTEIRSISKYGLSVVTVVFREGTDIYFARQLVGERLREASEGVQERYGRPVMGPISSGLGEIYQFVVRGKSQSVMELEELLDWYIGPQLRSVPGVVELNSFGGENKEYQVVVDPQRLQAAGFSIEEVVRALKRTNANAGGGYIERNRQQLVVGTVGLVQSLDDLRSVVLGATPQGTPITLGNIAQVRFGPQLRRGAASMDGHGEVVVGVALMLLGENSRTVTAGVKAKIEELKASLPVGVSIEPFYDRAALVDRVIGTVLRNLGEGAALVVLVLFFFLGSFRAGLIVALTIPFSMLFAVTLMRLTGVSGNLMSLGAIDFGLIVDGGVIVVENTMRRLRERPGKGAGVPSAEARLETFRAAAVEVLTASIFGTAIIAIVYVPVLALQGIEGKLFQPMARTVLFALAGALLASVTVTPVLCSLGLSGAEQEAETRVMRWFHRRYVPLLGRTLRRPGLVLGAGFAVLVASLGLFTRLGAEFVPQLDEGDLLVEVRRLPGVSLTESVALDRRIQRALLQVPEVAHAVSKTGAPELATDPMGLEQTDVYIQLKETGRWRKGLTKADVGARISEVLEAEIPDASAALSQPIQMRTNELIAGVRSDVAAQIYGPDLAVLQRLGDQIGDVLRRVPGAVDVRVEQGTGLSYLRIVPDRARLSRYGLTVEDVNLLTETIGVGARAGTVLEGDRRFGLVVKVPVEQENAVDGIRALPLKSTTGQMVPLGDVAEIRVEQGPNVVNRDKLSRRRTVEFNVRGRDLVSVVADARAAVTGNVTLPTGYRVEWGGQFENFLSARQRLTVVVPLALALILFLLWMAFRAVRPALLIFATIPLAAVGGVVALWLRGIPFSISAGVGFVALFGVAVLNGLVLVSFSRQLEEQGASPADAIRRAAELRLRPVMTTALVAALGFLPMALSSSPGSEVQRPLATVVIGGLLTATVLTLFLLPVLYTVSAKRRQSSPAPDQDNENLTSLQSTS
jgi:cobalt-zinc-cadmium resistance protein CzcA